MSKHPEKLRGERQGEAESGVEQGEDDFWLKAGIGFVVMGTQCSCCAWHERRRATVGNRYGRC